MFFLLEIMGDPDLVPPPWDLTGDAYLFIYRRLARRFQIPPHYLPSFAQGPPKGLGTVLIIQYTDSNVGPYGELLFNPGKVEYQGKRGYTISKIFVSSELSVRNGRRNWGIPKELAAFKTERLDLKRERIVLERGGKAFFDATIKSGKVKIPVNTKIVSLPLLQLLDSTLYEFTIKFDGRPRFAKFEYLAINNEVFPDISATTPSVGFHIENFKLTFPLPTTTRIG